mmetsp:Transcript_74759/g.217018  ORF Transcript_74759/g.217018 Transcript_74759/m.217018 type:complete len:253 (+) Transcript_74759:104-862(+)
MHCTYEASLPPRRRSAPPEAKRPTPLPPPEPPPLSKSIMFPAPTTSLTSGAVVPSIGCIPVALPSSSSWPRVGGGQALCTSSSRAAPRFPPHKCLIVVDGATVVVVGAAVASFVVLDASSLSPLRRHTSMPMILPIVALTGWPLSRRSKKSSGGKHFACLRVSHIVYSSLIKPSTLGPNTTPVAISRTTEETPAIFDTFVANQVAVRNPAMANIARKLLAPPILPPARDKAQALLDVKLDGAPWKHAAGAST